MFPRRDSHSPVCHTPPHARFTWKKKSTWVGYWNRRLVSLLFLFACIHVCVVYVCTFAYGCMCVYMCPSLYGRGGSDMHVEPCVLTSPSVIHTHKCSIFHYIQCFIIYLVLLVHWATAVDVCPHLPRATRLLGYCERGIFPHIFPDSFFA